MLLLTAVACAGSTCLAQDKADPVPEHVRLSLVFDKEQHFLGENILVHLCIENVGKEAFLIHRGGDYRGASRHLRYHVSATDEKGNAAADPDPSGFCMGGLSSWREVAPGTKQFDSLPLMRYCRFEKPGLYKIRVSHDLGWTATPDRPLPVAEGTIKLLMPDDEETEKVVHEMFRLPKDSTPVQGQRSKPYADFTCLAYPIYLPHLKRAAQADEDALTAVASIPSPDATKVLLKLLESKDPKFAQLALQHIRQRLPDPQLKGEQPYRRDEHRRWLVSRSWKPEFAAPLRALGRKLLTERPDEDAVDNGAFLLQCVGEKEDAAALMSALDHEVAELGRPTKAGERPAPRDTLEALLRAALVLEQRGLAVPNKPATPGEKIVFLCTLGAREDFRPAGWEAIIIELMRDERAVLREGALENLPPPPSQALLRPVADAMGDADAGVRIAACRVAWTVKAKEFLEPAVRLARTAKDESEFRAASAAASKQLPRTQWIDLIIARLDEPGMTAHCLSELFSLVTGYSGFGEKREYAADDGRKLKKRWQQFRSEHEKVLDGDRKWRFDDPQFPVRDLFPGYQFHGSHAVPLELKKK
jgi:hypothetical protein